MSLKLVGRKDILAIRSALHRAVAVVPGVNNESPIDSNRLMFILTIEHDASPESSSRWFAGLMQHGIGPDRDNLARRQELRFLLRKRQCIDVHHRAAGYTDKESCGQQQQAFAFYGEALKHGCRR
ncbi:MAG: hypothetical protein DWI29_01925 [Planctomycetota bacterium]|nr:MAG: hypothetical protein DWI29_01925 [Planctomycetota bacterium]